MSLLDGVRHRLYVLLRGEAYAREVERELRFHLELDRLLLANGRSSERDAELVARRHLGGVTYYREEVRQMTSLRWFDRIGQDLSYAWRGLARSPGFTATVVVTLGLGLGVNAAMYSFLDPVFFRPPEGVAAPRDVRRLFVYAPGRVSSSGGPFVFPYFNYPQYRGIREALGPNVPIAAYIGIDSMAMMDGQRAIPSRVAHVTASYFPLLGVRPQAGRFFTPDEDRIDDVGSTAVMSDALWRHAFNGSADILGKTVIIRKRRFTIIGIAPERFSGVDLDRVDLWLPMNAFDGQPVRGQPWYLGWGNYLRVFTRAGDRAAETHLTSTGALGYRQGAAAVYGRPDTSSLIMTGPLALARGPGDRQQELTVSTRVAGVALVVLLIACANVANLLVVRAMRRRREIAVRRALGVSNARLVGQLMTESLLLVAISGVFALILAVWVAAILRRMLLPNIHWATGAVDLKVVVFTTVAALIVGGLAGLAPAFHATKPDLINSLRAGSREGSYRRSHLRNALLITQAALSIVLVVGAAVFVRSLQNVESIDIGYDAAEIISAQPVFENRDEAASPAVSGAIAGVATELASIKEIERVAVATAAPMRGNTVTQLFLPGRDSLPKAAGDRGFPTGNYVSSEYFAATGLRVLQGRSFDKSDRSNTNESPASAIIVSATMARMLWPGEAAVGKCILVTKRSNPCTTVVGVVEDGRVWSVIEAPPMQYYFPQLESGGGTLIIRARAGGASAIKEQVRRLLMNRIPGAQSIRVKQMTEDLESQLRPWRLGANLFSAMGALALIVSAIGIYSVVSYAASQRTHEMGVRIALGARLSDIMDLVVYEAFRVVAVGVAIGIVASLGLGRFVASLLFGVTPYDASALITAVVVLCALGLIASVIPGWQAARADPLTALRAD